jgi:hypothetical protein
LHVKFRPVAARHSKRFFSHPSWPVEEFSYIFVRAETGPYYPARAIEKGKKKRQPLPEVAHRERFGQPFS